MFTGIVEEIGAVGRIVPGAQSIQLTVTARRVLEDLHVGDSIAVNGVCLTVVRFGAADFTADVMPETMRRSSLKALKLGAQVNLERALCLSGRLGGHIVSGHIDGVGEIARIEREDNALVVALRIPPALARYIVEKGSVAIDGASLTVAACGSDWFTVSLIPHTAAETTLGNKKTGDAVNIENDIIGKYVERFLSFPRGDAREPTGGLTMDFLKNNGY